MKKHLKKNQTLEDTANKHLQFRKTQRVFKKEIADILNLFFTKTQTKSSLGIKHFLKDPNING